MGKPQHGLLQEFFADGEQHLSHVDVVDRAAVGAAEKFGRKRAAKPNSALEDGGENLPKLCRRSSQSPGSPPARLRASAHAGAVEPPGDVVSIKALADPRHSRDN